MWGELEFLADIPFKSIIFLCSGSSRAALLGLNNLFLAFLFAGSVRLIPHLFINKVIILQPPHSTALFMEDPQPDYIASFLYSTALPRSFTPLPDSPSIYGPTPLYRPTLEVT